MRSSGDGTAGGAPGRRLGDSGPYPPPGSRLRPGWGDPHHSSAAGHVPQRPAVVQDSAEAASEPHENVGYRGPTACAAAGITYRQLDYWARTGLVEPSVRSAQGYVFAPPLPGSSFLQLVEALDPLQPAELELAGVPIQRMAASA